MLRKSIGVTLFAALGCCLLTFRRDNRCQATLEAARELRNGKRDSIPIDLSLDAVRNRGGVRILCLDGGGTKGVIQLAYLRALEEETGKSINELFDLIVGTSTGGLVAIALGLEGYKVADVEKLYTIMSEPVFGHSMESTVLHSLEIWNKGFSRADSHLLESIYKILATDSETETEKYMQSSYAGRPYVAVIAAQGKDKCFIKSWVDTNRSDNWPVWEALRATSAAPTYFSPHIRDGLRYVDGGIVSNNPCKDSYILARRIWGDDVPIKALVSIGTGSVASLNRKFILQDIVARATETESTHQDMLERSQMRQFRINGYWRFNLPIPDVDLAVYDHSILTQLRNATDRQLDESASRLDREILVKCLLSPSFVFPRKLTPYQSYDKDVYLHDVIANSKNIYMSFWYTGRKFLQDKESDWLAYFKRGLHVTLVLPKADEINMLADGVHFSKPGRSFRCKENELETDANRIIASRNSLIAIYEKGREEDPLLEGSLVVYESQFPQHYSLYTFDNEFAFLSVFEDDWGNEISSPMTIYWLKRDKAAKEFVDKEKRSLLTRGTKVYDSNDKNK